MEVLGHVVAIAQTIYSLCDQASSNKKQCQRVKMRIMMLIVTVQTLEKQPDKSQSLKAVMEEMKGSLENAKSWVIKYSHRAWWKQLLQANSIKEEFDLINDRLGDAALQVSVLLAAERRGEFIRFFKESTRKRQNENDIREDLNELKVYLEAHADTVYSKVDNAADKLNTLLSEFTKITAVCRRESWNITEIKEADLIRGALLMQKPGHDLYKGEYLKGPVAIKVFKGETEESEDFIRTTFRSESQTMKKFECPNILRLYGICIDKSGSQPSFSLVMDYCDKGTLRELLNTEPDLPGELRLRMVLDAARAMYRLHNASDKAILHGCLSSSKFLVDGNYSVKLSGFELSKTESSIRRTSNVIKRKENYEMAYIAPETLRNATYDKRSEIYSLGVIIYEIATGKIPCEGRSVTDSNLGNLQEKLHEEISAQLPVICPSILRDLIIRCQKKNPSHRPSAGVIVDQLITHVNKEDCCKPLADNTE